MFCKNCYYETKSTEIMIKKEVVHTVVDATYKNCVDIQLHSQDLIVIKNNNKV